MFTHERPGSFVAKRRKPKPRDPIVRVEARRLRQRLAEYYDGFGKAAPFRIEFPKGGCAAVIQVAANGSSSLVPWQMLAAAAVALMAVTGALLHRPVPQPAVAIVPARWVWAATGALDPAAESLARQITAAIANQGRASVVGWPVVARLRGSARDVAALGRSLGASQIILVSVRSEEGRKRITLFHLDAASGQKSAARDYFAGNLDTYPARDKVANEIAAQEPVSRR